MTGCSCTGVPSAFTAAVPAAPPAVPAVLPAAALPSAAVPAAAVSGTGSGSSQALPLTVMYPFSITQVSTLATSFAQAVIEHMAAMAAAAAAILKCIFIKALLTIRFTFYLCS